MWHLEGLGIGISIVSCLTAGIFLFFSLYRRRLRPPAADATPLQKAEYNLQRVAQLVGADELAAGWQLRSGGRTFRVYSGHITCSGRGLTCYQVNIGIPTDEKMATALLFLSKYPEAWDYWRQNHGRRWLPPDPRWSRRG